MTFTLRDMAFLAASAGSGAPWTPAELTTALWLDSSDSATLFDATSGGSLPAADGGVARWEDKSGNGRHVTQATSANRPLRRISAINGLDSIYFDGINDRLNFALAVIGTTHSVFVVFKPTIEAANGRLIGQWASGQAGRLLITTNENSGSTPTAGRMSTFNSTTTAGSGSAGFMADFAISNTATLFTSICTTGAENWKTYKNGVLQDSGTITTVYTGVSTAIGGRSAVDGNEPYDGEVCELIVLASVATTDETDRLTGYLAHKWGFAADLDSGHPYKSAPPLL